MKTKIRVLIALFLFLLSVNIAQASTINEFSDDDLRASKFRKFQVGYQTIDVFNTFYGMWLYSSFPYDLYTNQRVFNETYDKYRTVYVSEFASFETTSDGEPYFHITVKSGTYDRIVKYVQFVEYTPRQGNPIYITNRGITFGTTVREMVNAYGVNYETTRDGIYSSYRYHFRTTNNVYGSLTFYAKSDSTNEKLSKDIIYGICIDTLNP